MNLSDEMEEANRDLRPCQCGGKVLMRYDPGVSFVWCIKEGKSVKSLPDWQVLELKKSWNENDNN